MSIYFDFRPQLITIAAVETKYLAHLEIHFYDFSHLLNKLGLDYYIRYYTFVFEDMRLMVLVGQRSLSLVLTSYIHALKYNKSLQARCKFGEHFVPVIPTALQLTSVTCY